MIPWLLIAGLGNPDACYRRTRHNLGAAWVERLCSSYNAGLKTNNKLAATIATIDPNIKCIIPNDYMNHSGFAIKKASEYFKIDIQNILVVHDDLDLPAGEIRLKLHGGHGGHNGIKHIMEQLQANNFKRLRIGIGHPKIREQVADYVLSPANTSEQSVINTAIEDSMKIVPELLTINQEQIDWPTVMQILHQPKN